MNANWFIGLEVPPDGWFAPLMAGAPPELRALHPRDLHLTVAFLGPCGEARARDAWAAAAGAALRPRPVTLGAVTPMGNPRRPSAISVLLDEGRDAVAAYMATVQAAALEAAGLPPEARAPKPHVTVGRPRRSAGSEERRRILTWAAACAPVGAPLVLARLGLYTAAARGDERRYRTVASIVPDPTGQK